MQLNWHEILGLSVVAALVTTSGTLIGLFLKEVLFARSFEEWKFQRSLREISRKYRDPIVLAALDLCNRLDLICKDWPPDFLDSRLLKVTNAKPSLSTAVDTHFNQYMLISSVYRLCAFLGWIELFRQDTALLDPDSGLAPSKVRGAIYALRNDLAEGELTTASDWEQWHDAVIYREEQRAIGEIMISSDDSDKAVIGYAEFCESFPRDSEKSRVRWINSASMLFLDPKAEKDFRQIRMKHIIVHLVDLVERFSPGSLRDEHRAARARYIKLVEKTQAKNAQ